MNKWMLSESEWNTTYFKYASLATPGNDRYGNKLNPMRFIIDSTINTNFFFQIRNKFNDPFDSKFFIFEKATKKDIRNAVKIAVYKEYPDYDENNKKKIIADILKSNDITKKQDNYFKQVSNFLDNCGILCLCPACDNTLMWSHYAGNHTGICYEVDIGVIYKCLLSASENCFVGKVIYTQKFPNVNFISGILNEDTQNDFFEIANVFFTKSKIWKYEEEVRIVAPFFQSNILKCSSNALKSITVGAMAAAETIENIITALKKRGDNLPLYQMEQLKNKFNFNRIRIIY
jgi:hypothetical protein